MAAMAHSGISTVCAAPALQLSKRVAATSSESGAVSDESSSLDDQGLWTYKDCCVSC